MSDIKVKVAEMYDAIMGQCGDGGGYFASPQYKEAASIFAQIADERKHKWERIDDDESITFVDGEASAIFSRGCQGGYVTKEFYDFWFEGKAL
jgi:hypothetical protein